MGIATVAVHSTPDTGEPHSSEADESILLEGAAPTDTYLDAGAVLAAAKECGADAIHPGYGFLAENAGFARAVEEAGLTWIGPSPQSIELMGSKLESKRIMDEAGVPTLVAIPLGGVEDVEAAAAGMGYPILVKASAGGGGKGMRVVSDPEDLAASIASSKRESVAAFGDDTLFLERYLPEPRHIEIQVFGDKSGNVVSLYERECSIQRRHQKIIEESPSPVIDSETRKAMGEAAIAAAKAVDYVGAGTVEFLYQEGSFFFLEMNTRLQVEHPVTEMVTGLDLVRLQIEVAQGGKVPEPPPMNGHAIEARIYAEDAENDFLPVTGAIHEFAFDETEGLRVDSGVEAGSEVSVYYDPMLAKVIAWALDRNQAAANLAVALRGARIHGSTTNRALLVRILEHPEFLSGQTDTHFLERHDPAELGRSLADSEGELVAAVAAALADSARDRERMSVLTTAPPGWGNMSRPLPTRSYQGAHGIHEVSYALGQFDVPGLGTAVVRTATSERVTLSIASGDRHLRVSRHGDMRYVDSDDGPAVLTEVPRFPVPQSDDESGSLHAPMPGRILRIEAGDGDKVFEGQVLMVMEAMKMEHAIRAPHDGILTDIRCEVGDQVEAEHVLAVVESS